MSEQGDHDMSPYNARSPVVVDERDGCTRIAVTARNFDLKLFPYFAEIFQQRQWNGHDRFKLDLALTEEIDNSGMAMLLLLLDAAGGGQAKVELVNLGPKLKKTLRHAEFDKLFRID